jgi:arylsulfatase A-like enzyme
MIRSTYLAFLTLSAALAALSCGRSPAPPAKPVHWNPGLSLEEITAEAGSAVHGRSEYLTLWHGVDPSLLRVRAEQILGDDRSSLLAATPTRISVALASSTQARRFHSAVRRHGPRPPVPTSFEVFWQAQGEDPRSLFQLTLAPLTTQLSEPWHEVDFELPQQEGSLLLVCRDPRPIGERAPVTEVAWQSPVVYTPLRRAERRPDVLLVTIDTFRSDALEHAPALSALLAQGQLWPRAVAPSNWTLPSYASLFTGLPADQHHAGRGAFAVDATGLPENRQLSAVDSSLRTLADRFRTAGYATGMIHQNPMLESWTGLNRGFERYVRASDRSADALALAESFWEQNEGRPRFLVLHLMAPHLPYRFGPNPDPFDAMPLASFFSEDHTPEERAQFFALDPTRIETVRARYYAEVEQLDRALGPWLAGRLQAAEGQLIMGFHSDHGEELWDAGSFEHGHSFDDSVIRVPVALIAPGRLEAAVFPTSVPAEALAANLLELAAIPHDLPSRLQEPPEKFRSQMPLYRSLLQGREFSQESSSPLAFDAQRGSGGNGAAISERKRRMLAELGYLAGQEMKPPAKAAQEKRD